MKEYVLGFLFSEDRSHVGLVLKDRPEWQKGCLNGIGGKIEPEESAYQAMVREFEEETGVSIKQWDLFADMSFQNDILGGTALVHCYKSFGDGVFTMHQKETEEVHPYPIDSVVTYKRVAHLDMLLSMALNNQVIYCNINLK